MNASSPASYTIGIVAHEKRIDQAKRLFDQVGADVLQVDDANLRLGCEANHKRTWRSLLAVYAHFPGQQWLVVLEDDAQPVDGFRDQLTAALTTAPTPIVSLYLGQQHPAHWQPTIGRTTTKADRHNAHWITTNETLHAVALAIRTEHVPHLLQHWRTNLPTDQAITHWQQQHHHTTAYTWPSLTNHQDGPTLVKHPDGITRQPGRTAWRTGTHHTWTNTTTPMPNPRDEPQHNAATDQTTNDYANNSTA